MFSPLLRSSSALLVALALSLAACDEVACLRNSDCAGGYYCDTNLNCQLLPPDAGADDGGASDLGGADLTAAPDLAPRDAAADGGNGDGGDDAGDPPDMDFGDMSF
jgi:hypothetical protein